MAEKAEGPFTTMTLPQPTPAAPISTIGTRVMTAPPSTTPRRDAVLIALIPNQPSPMPVPMPMPIEPLNTSDPANVDVNSSFENVTGAQFRIYRDFEYAVPEYKYIAPAVFVVLLVLTGIFAYAVICQMRVGTNMIKASCMLLLGIAVADILTIAASVVEISYLYVMVSKDRLLSYDSCYTMTLLERIALIPHTVSIWLTVSISVQRYICIKWPFTAFKYVNRKISSILISSTVVAAVALHICRFVDINSKPVSLNSTEYPSVRLEPCQLVYADWVRDPTLYETKFTLVRVCIVQFIPCLTLVVFALLVGKGLHDYEQPLNTMTVVDDKRRKDRRRIGVFVICVAVLVCLVEIPAAILICLATAQQLSGEEMINIGTLKKAAIGLDICLFATYFCAFLIYCVMSRDIRILIRHALSRICCRSSEIVTTETPINTSANTLSKTTTSNEQIKPVEMTTLLAKQ